ncbi:MAG: VIT1/CCC1 transporter family protein [Promethearchaeota archaeon]
MENVNNNNSLEKDVHPDGPKHVNNDGSEEKQERDNKDNQTPSEDDLESGRYDEIQVENAQDLMLDDDYGESDDNLEDLESQETETKDLIAKPRKFDALRELFARWKLYAQISKLGIVARRFFVKNMTDGILTTLGVIIGFFVIYLGNPNPGSQNYINSNYMIILPGIGTAVAMCVSGVLASYLTESAERKKYLMMIKHDMAIVDPPPKKKNEKRKRTLQEKAERFATITASLIDGFSPFTAAIIVLIPFYFPGPPVLINFIVSIGLSCILLFLLGLYLGWLSKTNIAIYGLKMLATGILTLVIMYFLGELQ